MFATIPLGTILEMFLIVKLFVQNRLTIIHSSWMISNGWASVPTYSTMEELRMLCSQHRGIIDGVPVHSVRCLRQSGILSLSCRVPSFYEACLEEAWAIMNDADLDASRSTLPLVEETLPASTERLVHSSPVRSASSSSIRVVDTPMATTSSGAIQAPFVMAGLTDRLVNFSTNYNLQIFQ